jgi:hypothetical protein
MPGSSAAVSKRSIGPGFIALHKTKGPISIFRSFDSEPSAAVKTTACSANPALLVVNAVLDIARKLHSLFGVLLRPE